MNNFLKSAVIVIFLFSASAVDAQTPLHSGTQIYYLNNNLGIGTSSPSRLLDLRGGTAGNTNSRILRLAESNNNDRYDFSLETDNYLRLNNGISDATLMTWGMNGYVGIGTTDPKYPLTVSGAINSEANGDFYGAWFGGESRTSTPSINLGEWHNYRGTIFWDASDRKLVFETKTATTDYSNTMVLEDGKVGIGKTNPSYKLHVAGDIRGSSTISVEKNGDYRLALNGQNDSYLIARDDSNTDKFLIHTNGNSYFNGGNIGIGTSLPNYTLEIAGGPSAAKGINLKDSNSRIYFNGKRALEGHSSYNRLDIGEAFSKMALFGNVGIGTTDPSEKLEINGNALIDGEIYSKKIKISPTPGIWPDYVFEAGYNLKPLTEVEAFIKANKHLPEVPSAKEVEEKGQDLGDIQATLLKKMEEMTLYMIEMKKEIDALKKENKELKKVIKK